MSRRRTISVNRRRLLSGLSVGLCGLVAGCGGRFIGNPPRTPVLRLRDITVTPTESGWTLELTTNVAPVTDSIPDVTLVAYDEQGTTVCELPIGAADGGVTDYHLDCTDFPAIISARTGLDCPDVTVDILYWSGTAEQQERRIPDEITDSAELYRLTQRECGESLPPQRLLTRTET